MGAAITEAASWTARRPERILIAGLVLALAGLEAAHDAHDWLSATLLLTAALSASGVLLPATLRRLALLLAGIVAASSGALVSIALSGTIHTVREQREFDVLFYALLLAGTAALVGQIWNHVDNRVESTRHQRQLHRIETTLSRLNGAAARHARPSPRSSAHAPVPTGRLRRQASSASTRRSSPRS